MSKLGLFSGLIAGIIIGANWEKIQKEAGPMLKKVEELVVPLSMSLTKNVIKIQENVSDYLAERNSMHSAETAKGSPSVRKKKAGSTTTQRVLD